MRQMFQRIMVSLPLVAILVVVGCRTTSADLADAGHMASLTISSRSEVDILRAMEAVFVANGYQHMGDLTFDKKGSAWETALYGGWNADGVWIRLKASVDPGPSGTYVIGCDAFRVTGHNQGVMEEEKKTTHAYRDECKKILDEVQARLAQGGAAAVQP
jgi:hypothetical protein